MKARCLSDAGQIGDTWSLSSSFAQSGDIVEKRAY